MNLRTASARTSLSLLMLLVLPSSKFCSYALLGLYCVNSCLLRRPVDAEANGGETAPGQPGFTGGTPRAHIGDLVGQRHDQIQIALA